MRAEQEIALQLTLKTLEKINFSSLDQTKKLPYEIYNSIYQNIDRKEYI